MFLYFREERKDLIQCYKILHEDEFQKIKNNLFKGFPHRLFHNDLEFVLDQEQIAYLINDLKTSGKKKKFYVIRFLVLRSFIEALTKSNVAPVYLKVPVEQLVTFNQAILGYIEVMQIIDLTKSTNQSALIYRDDFGQASKSNFLS